MVDFNAWFGALLDVLAVDEDACYALIRSVIGRSEAMVRLFEGDLTGPEAVSYARSLLELGRRTEASEVILALLAG